MLEKEMQIYEDNHYTLHWYDMNKFLVILKKYPEYKFLTEVSARTLCITCRDLDYAFKDFFNGVRRFPKFKTKKDFGELSFPVRGEPERFYFRDDYVKIEKIGKVKVKKKNNILKSANRLYNIRIKKVKTKWILSAGIDCDSQVVELTDKVVGIDLGIKELATCSFGGEKYVFHNIAKSNRMKQLVRKEKHIKRNLRRKFNKNGSYEHTKNIDREIKRLWKVEAKISNIKKDNIYRAIHSIISLLPRMIVIEDLNLKSLRKKNYYGMDIKSASLHEFIYQIKNRAERWNIEFIKADRFYPSTKRCSNCGNVKEEVSLRTRIYHCDKCGLTIDRDFNAAENLRKYGESL